MIDKTKNYEIGDLINLQIIVGEDKAKSTTTLLKIINIYENIEALKDGYCIIGFVELK